MGAKHEEVLGQTSFILHIDVILCQSMIIESLLIKSQVLFEEI